MNSFAVQVASPFSAASSRADLLLLSPAASSEPLAAASPSPSACSPCLLLQSVASSIAAAPSLLGFPLASKTAPPDAATTLQGYPVSPVPSSTACLGFQLSAAMTLQGSPEAA